MITINIENSGEAFNEPRPEIARILRELADSIELGTDRTTVRDINGNKCGTVAMALEDAEISVEHLPADDSEGGLL